MMKIRTGSGLAPLLAAGMLCAFAPQAQAVQATGGTVTNYVENGTNFIAHIFTSTVETTNLNATNADIVIAPWNDFSTEGDEEAVITLLSGPYRIGAANSATVTVVDTVLTPYYVSTNGTQTAPYDDWNKAFTNLQAALDYGSAKVSAILYLAGNQTFSTPTNGAEATSLYVWQSATNVTLSGGWFTNATPPDTRTNNTVLKRVAGNMRVMRMTGVSNAVIENVTIREGYNVPNGSKGGGLWVNNCASVTFAGCTIAGCVNTTRGIYGEGVALMNSSVVMTNCTIADNSNNGEYSGGDGLWVDGSSRATLIRSFVLRNKGDNSGGNGNRGVGILNDGILNLIETVVSGNDGGGASNGGATGGGIYNSGTLTMQNCLVYSNRVYNGSGDGLILAGGAATLVNCTIANNWGNGIQYTGGNVAMTNCIVWGHSSLDLQSFNAAALSNIWFSSIGTSPNNSGVQGCLTPAAGPRFADSNYFHLASVVSNYSGGYFTGGTWTTSLVHSALIDFGNPNSPYSREPAPNGGRINMGYDGNTEVASLTLVLPPTPPAVTNLGSLYWGHRTVTLYGQVLDPGYPTPQGFFRYWSAGGATSETARAEQIGAFNASLSGLTPGQTYQFVAVASNATEEVVSDVKSFAMLPTPAYLYVATNGNDTAGTNWVTAYSTVQKALDLAEAGDTIYLAGHTFAGGVDPAVRPHPRNAVAVWQNATNIAMKGGYDALSGGGSNPGTRSSTTTVRRTAYNNHVLSMIGVTNCTIEQVTFREGLNGVNGSYAICGSGVYMADCRSVTLASCVIADNVNSGSGSGIGLGLTQSSAVLTNCTIADNYGANERSAGMGLAVDGSSALTVTRSFILRNTGRNHGGNGNQGMGFYNEGTLNLNETVVSGNEAYNDNNTAVHAGGVNYGTLTMQNCLVYSNRAWGSTSPDGLYLAGGSATLLNCTFANNWANGIQYAGGNVAMTNCIVWGHSNLDLQSFTAAAKSNVWYSNVGSGGNASGVQGCKTVDPSFADSNYFHLASVVSNYSGGYFAGGTWTTSLVHSALIDAGDPNSPYSREPAPNGGRINMGYDGNTEVASLTLVLPPTPPAVTNLGSLYWGHRTVTLYGQVLDSGYPTPQGFFRYWPVGGATGETARAEQTGAFNASLTGLTPGQTYQFVAVASNTSAEVVSDVRSFAMLPTPSYLYVATNGNDTAGTNWVTAYSTVQKALDVAEAGDTIYLAGHTFAGGVDPAVSPHPRNAVAVWQNATNIAMKGGYDAVSGGGSSPGARSSTTTVKRTTYNCRVLSMINATNCTVEQVTIRDGSGARDGGGVYLTNCWSVTFAGCAINNNAGSRYGGGVCFDRSSVVLTNTTIADNQGSNGAGDFGGGIYVDALSRVTLIRSVLARNWIGSGGPADGRTGGGFYNAGALDMLETVLVGNYGYVNMPGGGGQNVGVLTMRNCLVYSNQCAGAANTSDGLRLVGGSATLVNCTFANNNAYGIQYVGGGVGVTNCIVWGHATADLTGFGAGQLANVGYSAFAVPNQHGVNNCITNDPLFVGAATNDYRLLTRPIPSPAIDAGFKELSGWMLGALDLAGEKRRQGATLDMGAYESPAPQGSVLMFR